MFIALVWNLIVTAALAILLAAAGRLNVLVCRPALRHTLWLLLLVKLVTPPLIPVPLLPAAVPDRVIADGAVTASTTDAASVPRPVWESGSPASDRTVDDVLQAAPSETPAVAERSSPHARRASFAHGLVALSLIGTCLLIIVHAFRTARLTCHLRQFGTGNATVARICRAAATELGVRATVRSCAIDARTVPFLWGWGRPLVVIPRQLIAQLDEEELRCIVMHELAHYARGDHWTNLLALLVKSVFWWNPVTWWAHREMRAAQESCCDAVAIERADTTRQNYAATLLTALDFVQPDAAAGSTLVLQMGSRNSLLRRFEMIGNTHLNYRVSRGTMLVLVLLMLPLCCLPVRSQETNAPAVLATDRSLSTDESAQKLESPTHNGGEPGSENPLVPPLSGDIVTVKVELPSARSVWETVRGLFSAVTVGPEVKVAADAQQLYLTGLVLVGDPTQAENTTSAWVLDRTTGKKNILRVGSSFRVGESSAAVDSIAGDTVLVRVDKKVFRWKLGMRFSDVLTSEPAPAPATEAEAGTNVKGELKGGGLSGPVQIELLTDSDVVILRGKSEDVQRVTKVLGQVRSSNLESERAQSEEQQVIEVYPVAPLDPDMVLPVLQTLFAQQSGVRIAVDRKANKVVVFGTRQDHQRVKDLLGKMMPADPDRRKSEERGDRAPGPHGRDNVKIRFNFRFQPWSDVLEWFADTAGLSLVAGGAVPGTFNYTDAREYTVSEAMEVLNGVLATKGYALIARDRVLLVVKIDDGIPANLVPRVKQ